ncbi:MAG: J domain-containing protein [Streptosporangiaceae bacterium]
MIRTGGPGPDPFAALGLRADPALTDDDVRAAWRRIAEATHPDRADGGDPARFAAAAAAYSQLRTSFGRGEASADLASGPRRLRPQSVAWLARFRSRPIRAGRLILRITVAVATGLFGLLAAGSGPAGPAIAVGALTWLLVTGRRDIGHR